MLSVQGATSGQQVPGVLCHISTHAPRAGSDSFVLLSRSRNFTFQSTLPVRGATPPDCPPEPSRCNFNPRSPCGERRLGSWNWTLLFHISIHAPRAGSDSFRSLLLFCCYISIHAPRAGSDPSLLLVQGGLTHISIHAPRAGSDAPTAPICSMRAAFQSTLPVRGATSTAIVGMRWQTIFQSTLPVRGATDHF